MGDEAAAAARALLEAGNFTLAIERAEARLRQQPHDAEAREVLGDALLKSGDVTRLERMSVDWLQASPWVSVPHALLLQCYVRRGDGPLARAVIEHFRRACPGRTKELQRMEALFDATFVPERPAWIAAPAAATPLVASRAALLRQMPGAYTLLRLLRGRPKPDATLADS